MSETLPRDLWVRQMEQLPPKTLLSSITSYTTASSHATDHLAEYLKARASAEGEYVQVLQKLQRRFTLAQGGSERGETGEGGMSERFEEEIKLTIKTHSDYASIITRDYSEPLRTLPSLPPSSSDRLERTLKSYESANSKIAKAQKKGGAKLLAAQQDAADLQRQLSAQLVPEFIALAQQTTYHRLTMMKELGVKWETWQAEMGNRRAAASEVGMMQVLALEPEELVRSLPRTAFGVTAGSGGGFVDAPRPSAGTPTRSSTLRRPTLTSDASSARSSRHPSDFTSAAGPQTPSGGGSGGGFASTLKSKFGRKNSTMVPLGGGGSFRGRAGSDAAPASGNINAGRGQNMDSVSSRVQSGSTMPAALASPVPLEASTHARGRPVDEEGFSVPPEDRGYAPWERNTQGGRRDLLDDDNDEESGYAGHGERDETITALPTTASPLNESPSAIAQGNNNKFASLSLAPTPIQESETDRAAALAKMQSTLLAQGPAGTSNSGNGSAPNRRATMRARRDVRNTMFTAVDRAGDDTSLGETVKRQRGTSGDIFGGAVSSAAALTPTRGVAALATNVRADSAIPSPASTTMNPFDGNVSSAPMGSGLRASFTETVNAVLTSAGVQRIMITGEISLTLRDAHLGGLDTSTPLHIRLNAFEQLEKVAPNPKYLSQVPNVPGEYLLDLDTLAHITSAAAPNARPPILFKYQVHIGDGKAGEWAPLEIMPQWKPMKGETRLVLTYGVNTRGRLASRIASMKTDGPIALQDLTLTVGLSGAPVTTVQAKPAGGTWQPERRKITWTLPDLPLGASATPSEGKIVARFITEGEEFGQPDQVTAQWRVSGTLSTGLDIVVVDPAAAWRFEQVRRGVVSGKYVAE
ncbi:hypothetical protein QFC22_005220 [Naganishia vaughanmartiniae]|uniref:Uncharacterized protein n=1 Tax=Naganishia vaughanmartiniae TaxID=1424756 RepID=A0ACC2WV17_9TREE|nr:hypothetical protein QFC22_005220 [Naganishia vaughanmartiniae]